MTGFETPDGYLPANEYEPRGCAPPHPGHRRLSGDGRLAHTSAPRASLSLWRRQNAVLIDEHAPFGRTAEMFGIAASG
jgi:hypothetical protein